MSGNSKETELKNSFIKQARILEDNTYLKSDGGNLASFLYRLKEEYPRYYNKIRLIIRQIAPFFDDFILTPNKDYIEFGVFRLSDETLRFMALATLLIQPKETMPAIIIID